MDKVKICDLPDHLQQNYLDYQNKILHLILDEMKKEKNITLFLNVLVGACANIVGLVSRDTGEEVLNNFSSEFKIIAERAFKGKKD